MFGTNRKVLSKTAHVLYENPISFWFKSYSHCSVYRGQTDGQTARMIIPQTSFAGGY